MQQYIRIYFFSLPVVVIAKSQAAISRVGPEGLVVIATVQVVIPIDRLQHKNGSTPRLMLAALLLVTPHRKIVSFFFCDPSGSGKAGLFSYGACFISCNQAMHL